MSIKIKGKGKRMLRAREITVEKKKNVFTTRVHSM